MFDITTMKKENYKKLESVNASQVKANENLAKKVGEDSIVIIPRLDIGICYIAKVKEFELNDNPSWIENYLDLREKQGSGITDKKSHVGDVVQCWPIKGKIKEVPFPIIPRWISQSLLNRSTAGIIYDSIDGTSAYDVMLSIYNNKYKSDLRKTKNIDVISKRMIDWITPTILEHICCELLQLEHPKEHWFHVGGTGDCGVDGLGYDQHMKLTGILQCKWKYYRIKTLTDELRESTKNLSSMGQITKIYLGLLIDVDENLLKGVNLGRDLIIMDRKEIARLMVKHKDRCPYSKMIGIG